jgi:zinc protease
MLFKPTKADLKRPGQESSSMKFEREVGCILNANTWMDRTTYYFSYPVEYFDRALQIEAERMNGVVLTDKELRPEQGNVLSEFDMNNGDPLFALAVQMCGLAFQSHPYGHETIGYREDIEDYTAEKLEKFYRNYYRPDNAVMMVVGDIDKGKALDSIRKHFAEISRPNTIIPRFSIREPKQEGLRRVTIERPANVNLLSIGFKMPGFPSEDWFVTKIMMETMTGGPESILHKLLVDTGLASSVGSIMDDPVSEEYLGFITITLAPSKTHDEIETLILKTIRSLTKEDVDLLIKKTKERIITSELIARQNSLKIVQELTEYTSAGSWETYTKTPEILKKVTTKRVMARLEKSFVENNLTIGHFIGKK